MNKTFTHLSSAFWGIFVIASFVACSDDNDSPGDDPLSPDNPNAPWEIKLVTEIEEDNTSIRIKIPEPFCQTCDCRRCSGFARSRKTVSFVVCRQKMYYDITRRGLFKIRIGKSQWTVRPQNRGSRSAIVYNKNGNYTI